MTLQEKLKYLKDLRAKATEGKWTNQGDIYIFSSNGVMVADNNDDHALLRARGVGGGMTREQQQNNIDFITTSANEWNNIITALEKAAHALWWSGVYDRDIGVDKIDPIKLERQRYDMNMETLSEIKKILKVYE